MRKKYNKSEDKIEQDILTLKGLRFQMKLVITLKNNKKPIGK